MCYQLLRSDHPTREVIVSIAEDLKFELHAWEGIMASVDTMLHGWRNIALTLIDGVLNVIAFHEKAGRSQVDSFVLDKVFVFLSAESPLSPPFHPHS